jgi:malonyl-CoA O-methyltransferase
MNAPNNALLKSVLQSSQHRAAGSLILTERQIVNKLKVADGFDKAASRYNSLAKVQQEIADYGLSRLEQMSVNSAQCLLDIGCGTASSFSRLVNIADHVVGLDISLNMLCQATQDADQQNRVGFTAINADAEALPIQSSSIDVVYSSMALQWCESPKLALNEVKRILTPNGKALLCILTGESFNHLQSAWQHIRLPCRINQFHSKQVWLNAAKHLQNDFTYCIKHFTSHHVTIMDMLHSIKRIGANTRIADSSKASNYISRQEIAALTEHMILQLGTQQTFPLCYQLLFLEIENSAS